ncbi:MAG: REJ domain-containing protein, partial [Myxococcota bacterium]
MRVTVWDNGVNNSALGTLLVTPSEIVAVIEGGDRTVDRESLLVLDASNSYDPDDLGELVYNWKCDLCAPAAELSSTSVLTVSVSAFEPQTYRFDVVVTSIDARNATATATITVSAADFVPVVSIASLVFTKANPSARLVLTGSVDRGPSDIAAMWTMDGALTGGTDFDDAARTPLTTTIAAETGNLTIAVAVYLVLPAGSLVAGASYTFFLSAVAGDSQGGSSITVVANKPPVPGVVECDPTSGQVLTTRFTMSANLWSDDAEDLPLLYAFAYLAASGSQTLLRESTPSPQYGNVLLPGGTGANSTLITVVQAYDQLGASDIATTAVVVSAQSELSSDALANATDSLIGDALASADTEAVFQVANAVTSLLEVSSDEEAVVVCNPNCTVLGRSICDAAESRCGDCVDPLVGDDGPSIEPCYEQVGSCYDGVQGESETDVDCGGGDCPLKCAQGSACTVREDCKTDRCVGLLCAAPIKVCDGGCGLGSCVHYDQSGAVMASEACDESNLWCSAACVCPTD